MLIGWAALVQGALLLQLGAFLMPMAIMAECLDVQLWRPISLLSWALCIPPASPFAAGRPRGFELYMLRVAGACCLLAWLLAAGLKFFGVQMVCSLEAQSPMAARKRGEFIWLCGRPLQC